jgi:hypothetical protein
MAGDSAMASVLLGCNNFVRRIEMKNIPMPGAISRDEMRQIKADLVKSRQLIAEAKIAVASTKALLASMK